MFVLDETSWIATQAEGYLERLEGLLDNMERLRDDNRVCLFSEELFHLEIYEGQALYDLFSGNSSLPIPREIQERITAEFGRLRAWGEMDRPWPADFDVSIGNAGPVFAPSLAWAMAQAALGSRQAVPCLIAANAWPSGLQTITVADSQAGVWLVSQVSDPGYYRWLAIHGTDRPAELDELLGMAFPNLEFVADCTDGIKEMSLGYRDLIGSIVETLGVLSDEGPRIFAESWQVAPNAFGSLGVSISDENGGTKGNKKAERAHTRDHGGRAIPFWWHIKLQPDRDRIHLDATPLHDNGKIIVGIFCRHLTV